MVRCADQEALQDVQQLPTPTVEQLLSTRPGTAVVGACPVGDALTGTALMAATSDGKLQCLWPSSSQRADLVRVCPSSGLGVPSCTASTLQAGVAAWPLLSGDAPHGEGWRDKQSEHLQQHRHESSLYWH